MYDVWADGENQSRVFFIFRGEMILQGTPGIALLLGQTGNESCEVAATFPAQKGSYTRGKFRTLNPRVLEAGRHLCRSSMTLLAQRRVIQSQKIQSRVSTTQNSHQPLSACSLTSIEELVLHTVALHLLLAAWLLPAHLQGCGAQGREHQAGRGVRDAQRLPGV